VNKESNFQVHIGQSKDFLRVLQKASYLNCGPLRKFFDDRLREGQLNFVIDFQDCSSVDSTFLGILVGVAIKLKRAVEPGTLTLVNLRNRNLETVKNLGIHKLCEISSMEVSDSDQLENLLTQENNAEACSKTIYDAHKTLMHLNQKNLKMFSDIVNYLESDQGEPASPR
tara:strand:- start:816 stop:1325 length:510 start_codon:yes stop_codon:yes gene_type:complete